METPSNGYSAPVVIELDVGGEVLKVAQVGPAGIILREARVLEACEAVLCIRIGRNTETHIVALLGTGGEKSKHLSYR